MKIAFIGLGNMGAPMATNLVKAGFEVHVFDLVAEALKALEAEGATPGSSALEVARDADVVVSMLPAGRHVRSLYLGTDDNPGLFSRLNSKPLIIDASTISPDDARVVGGAAAEHGLRYLDAPVSGGIAGAHAGTLTFIVGGAAEDFVTAQPVLDVMGKNIFHAGPVGSGQVAKICNNMLLGILMSGTAEALALGVRNGMDPTVLSEIMKQSSGGNWALNVYNPWPGVMDGSAASRDYQGGFLTDLMAKDLGLAWELALGSGAAVPMGSQARNLFVQHSAQGNGKLDFSSIQWLYRAGMES
ncbi:3-hydroxyisobutyrate dehydrogenase [Halomonas huangheensis]|uniref:3-hydroxyisobutyrate dehydrogenase n=1 Tax=Halomonas huangheensis TaxID=1178482 RepID=W1NBV9_9GAMM|nr:3-hydroxyisobutyrate dehydrogenase [Halomonas huangheensis]ERL52691.1 3-hydroxyisobutyrate dehydrogenase [Halomonas huangheensis]